MKSNGLSPEKCSGSAWAVTESREAAVALDIGEYCRRVEEHLTRVNSGHLVRIVGTGFTVVRAWAEAGIPLSIVFRGIDMKAERHRDGAATRPLRIEFCEPDVQSVFQNWRRAVGLGVGRSDHAGTPAPHVAGGLQPAGDGDAEESDAAGDSRARRPSLTKHLDRTIDRLSRAGGRLEWPEPLRDACDTVLQQLVDLRAQAKKVRGSARDELAARLPALDTALAAALRLHAPDSLRQSLRQEAVTELAAYRSRLSAEQWDRSIDVTTDRLIRDRLGLPVIDL